MHWNRKVVALFAVASVCAVADAGAVETPLPKVGGEFAAKLGPQIPTGAQGPTSLRLHATVSARDGGHPPALRTAAIGLDKDITLDPGQLPVCRRSDAGTASGPRCKGASVGSGQVQIEMPSGKRIPVKLLALNGGSLGNGTTKILLVAMPSGGQAPIVTSLIFRARRQGIYGSEGVWRIPPLFNGQGSIVRFDLKLARTEGKGSTAHAFVSARCSDGRFQASLEGRLQDEVDSGIGDQSLFRTSVSSC